MSLPALRAGSYAAGGRALSRLEQRAWELLRRALQRVYLSSLLYFLDTGFCSRFLPTALLTDAGL
jgi:hypothetical protein